MNDLWNFHGYIALPLEEYGRNYMGECRYTADQIANGKFVETMLCILSRVYPPSEFSEFESQCKPFSGMRGNDIPPENANELFAEFKRLIRNARHQEHI